MALLLKPQFPSCMSKKIGLGPIKARLYSNMHDWMVYNAYIHVHAVAYIGSNFSMGAGGGGSSFEWKKSKAIYIS